MPMGNCEGYYQVVPDNIMKKVVGKAIYDKCKKAYDALVNSGMPDWDIDDNLDNGRDADISPEWTAFVDMYDKLTGKFAEKTHMSVYALYTDGDGDAYDDLLPHKWFWVIPESCVWSRRMTPTAEKFIEKYSLKRQPAIERDSRFSRYG